MTIWRWRFKRWRCGIAAYRAGEAYREHPTEGRWMTWQMCRAAIRRLDASRP